MSTPIYVRLTFDKCWEYYKNPEAQVYINVALFSNQPNAAEAREYFIAKLCQELPEDPDMMWTDIEKYDIGARNKLSFQIKCNLLALRTLRKHRPSATSERKALIAQALHVRKLRKENRLWASKNSLWLLPHYLPRQKRMAPPKKPTNRYLRIQLSSVGK